MTITHVPIERRQFLKLAALLTFAASVPVGLAGTVAESKLILLGTAGGPTPKPNRYPSAYALSIDDRIYIVDAGNGVAQQIAKAKLNINNVRHIFVTHHHSDHNVDVGTIAQLAWAANPGESIDGMGAAPY